MHCGSLTGDTAAARVYRVLKDLNGEAIGNYELMLKAECPAVGTRVSECNKQLVHEHIECVQVGKRFFYRLVKRNEQLSLALVS